MIVAQLNHLKFVPNEVLANLPETTKQTATCDSVTCDSVLLMTAACDEERATSRTFPFRLFLLHKDNVFKT